MITLHQPLTLAECQIVREWRNAPDVLPMLRTGTKTEADQEFFYQNIICNPESHHQYYAILDDGRFIGMGGLTYIDRAKQQGEISLILGPEFRGLGLGVEAVETLIAEAYGPLGLTSIVGECYAAGNLSFWLSRIRERPAMIRWQWEKP